MFMTANPNDPLFMATRGGEDALFMTASQDLFISTTESEEPVFMTAGPYPISTQVSVELKEGHTDEVPLGGKGIDDNTPTCTNQVSAGSKDDQTPNSLEGSLQMTLTSPISPGASLEMGLTLTKLLRQRHLVESVPEQSVLASWSNSIVQENHFLPEVCDIFSSYRSASYIIVALFCPQWRWTNSKRNFIPLYICSSVLFCFFINKTN